MFCSRKLHLLLLYADSYLKLQRHKVVLYKSRGSRGICNRISQDKIITSRDCNFIKQSHINVCDMNG